MCVLVSSCVSWCPHVIMCVLVTGVAARTGPKRRQLGEKGNLIAHRTAAQRQQWGPAETAAGRQHHVCPGVLMCVLVSSCVSWCPHVIMCVLVTGVAARTGPKRRQLGEKGNSIAHRTASRRQRRGPAWTGGNCGPEATVRTGVDRVGNRGGPAGTDVDRWGPAGTAARRRPHVCPGVLMCVLVSSCYHVCPCHGSSRKNRTQTPTTWGKRQLNCSPDCVTEGTAGTGVDRRELRHGGDIMCVLVSSCYHVCSCHGSSRKNRTQTPTTWGKRQLNCSPDCVTEATAGTGVDRRELRPRGDSEDRRGPGLWLPDS
ncbi:uncharacterized protein LOC117749133 [Cyclopterus lumpus]|uniref:uncharacterized protein LOC117749133 n=1 Tax=Cyclopterus lumpus TaxID=8103 RepID=UPI00148635FC|nr:uncharacterized protein LOC117749133 [Cyclopterus lumpus]